MADYFPCHISIGGPVPKRLANRLCKAIKESGMSRDWGAAPYEPCEPGELVTEAAGSTLGLCDDQASYGVCESLESFLRKHKIPFDRVSDAKYEHSGERVCYRPGSVDRVFSADQDGEAHVPLKDVLLIKAALKAKRYDKALAICDKAAPDFPDLEPFSFKE